MSAWYSFVCPTCHRVREVRDPKAEISCSHYQSAEDKPPALMKPYRSPAHPVEEREAE